MSTLHNTAGYFPQDPNNPESNINNIMYVLFSIQKDLGDLKDTVKQTQHDVHGVKTDMADLSAILKGVGGQDQLGLLHRVSDLEARVKIHDDRAREIKSTINTIRILAISAISFGGSTLGWKIIEYLLNR